MSGMRAWNSPNRKLMRSMGLAAHLPVITPLTMDTVKQSIANAMARNMMSIMFIYVKNANSFCCFQ